MPWLWPRDGAARKQSGDALVVVPLLALAPGMLDRAGVKQVALTKAADPAHRRHALLESDEAAIAAAAACAAAVLRAPWVGIGAADEGIRTSSANALSATKTDLDLAM